MVKLPRFITGASCVLSIVVGVAMMSTTYAATPALNTTESSKQVSVVYHIGDSDTQALGALRNMRNHLDAAPDTKIVAVANSDGIDFLSNDYKDANIVGPLIAGLAARGVVFEVCELTVKTKNMTQDDFVLEADFTPSAVARMGQLQVLEGYGYIKP